ncbi:MAG: TetR/AcrR family transcriptional regulator [Sandaracinaceae bacterium]|nr:TetR/AcrR family transcriptional regulator [Sandaracinaceae bacterium]
MPKEPTPALSTRERILDAAEDTFAQVGYEAASLSAIADRVGIRTPSLYKHFPSKQDMYTAVLERLLLPHTEAMNALLVRPTDHAEATRNLAAVVGLYFARPNLARLVQHAALARGPELEVIVERWYGPLLARAAELTPSATIAERTVTPQALVIAVHAMLSGLVTLAPLHERAGAPPSEALMVVLGTWVHALWGVPTP